MYCTWLNFLRFFRCYLANTSRIISFNCFRYCAVILFIEHRDWMTSIIKIYITTRGKLNKILLCQIIMRKSLRIVNFFSNCNMEHSSKKNIKQLKSVQNYQVADIKGTVWIVYRDSIFYKKFWGNISERPIECKAEWE